MKNASYPSHFPQKALEELLGVVMHNQSSDFYRQHLKAFKSVRHITRSSWQRFPLLTREEISRVPLWDRAFVPRSRVSFIRNTYGTSGKGILITPRVTYGNYDNPYSLMNMRRLMSFFAATHFGFPQSETGVQAWFGDVGNLEMSAAIIEAADIDALYITPYTALTIVPLLDARAIIDQIKVVQLCGERCSPLQFQKLKECYRRATVYSNYSSSETRETVAVTCEHDRASGGSLVMESVPEVYCEIVHPEKRTTISDVGVPGELVVTTLDPRIPFPLIRYATGDIAMYVERNCECAIRQWGFEILGRATVFPVRLVRGELNVNAIEAALAKLHLFSEYFEAHYLDEDVGKISLPRVHLVLVNEVEDRQDVHLSNLIAENLYVFPTYTYAQGVDDGIYLPLTVSFIGKTPAGALGKQKAPVVVRHVM